jgi:hypothetical protein
MLQVQSPFPNPGAAGFIIGTADPVRIIQRNRDGSMLVQRTGQMARAEGASRTRTVQAGEIVATRDEALQPAKPSRRRKAA